MTHEKKTSEGVRNDDFDASLPEPVQDEPATYRYQCILLENLLNLLQNFLIDQERNRFNNGIMSFRRGHPFLELTLKEQRVSCP